MNIFDLDSQHALLSPSSAHRWSVCTGSIQLSQQVPETTTKNPAAVLGSIAHKIAELCFIQNKDPFEIYFEYKEEIKSFRVDFDIDEILPAINSYIEYVKSHVSKDTITYLEHRIDIDPLIPECFGTADFIAYDPKTKHCHIFDLKMGQIFVPVQGNLQLLLYAAGIRQSLHPDVDLFTLHIFQPLIHNISTTVLYPNALDSVIGPLQSAAKQALSLEAKFVPEAKICEYCRAKQICPSFQKIFDTLPLEIGSTPITDASLTKKIQILNFEKSILNYIKDVKSELLQRALNGEEIPGWEVGKKRKMSKWNEDAEAHLVEKLGENAYQDKKLITITEARKVLSSEEVDDLIYQPEAEDTLVKVKNGNAGKLLLSED